MPKIYDPITQCITEITQEEFEKQMAAGKNERYQVFVCAVEKYAKILNLTKDDGVKALALIARTDLKYMCYWAEAPEFIERAFAEIQPNNAQGPARWI